MQRGGDPRQLSSYVQKRIQSESTTLGSHGQDLLHRVEGHRRRLVGEAMTDSLEEEISVTVTAGLSK